MATKNFAAIWACALSLPAIVFGQTIAPGSPCQGQTYCETTDFSPSGPRVTREWRHQKDATPYRIEIDGAGIGRPVIGNLRLTRDSDGAWYAVRANGERLSLLKAGEKLPKTIRSIEEGGVKWRLTITAQMIPVERPGIATEDEPKLNLVLRKVCKVGKNG